MVIQYEWIDDLQFYVLFNIISVISERWKVDNERLCAMELCLRDRFFVVALLFYVHGKHLRSCWDGQLT